MKLHNLFFLGSFILFAALPAFAGDGSTTESVTTPVDSRYGLFNLFDTRSSYGSFPEPFLVDDSDLERNEFRLDLLHTNGGNQHSEDFLGEVEHGFGLVTVELEAPAEWDDFQGRRVSGMDNINPGVRFPFYMYVSPGGFINTTFGAGFELGVPMHSSVSKNTEVVPKLFNDLSLGSHITLQSILGYSMMYGPHAYEGGLNTFEYGFVLGYTISRDELGIPNIQEIIPVFELQGYKELDKGNAAYDEVLGNAAVRFNMKAIGTIQPRLGLGFVFPLDNAARQDLHWGIFSSLVFEF
jgi:hypothetical protein